ncbi:MAG TPA: VOC family protein [Solirubrobacter sp.]|nr:VOC family protein [Solirubrobacter sp.]
MKLEGLHHITMITGDAQKNVDFYAGTLGLRLVKKTVNFDSPDAYHLYFGDEVGSPGTILTWFEFPGAWRGRAGAGMIHTIQLAVASEAALDFWAERLRAYGAERAGDSLFFEDYDGLRFELVVSDMKPRRAEHPEIPAEHAIIGIAGARAYGAIGAHPLLTDTLGFVEEDGVYRLGDFTWTYDPAPEARGLDGAGTVHHIAWASRDEDHLAWRARVAEAGMHVTGVRDRDYFRSIYFREPRGILFEIATLSPGFAIDEDPDHLGEQLRLPAQHEHLRAQLERTLTPVVNPRAAVAR